MISTIFAEGLRRDTGIVSIMLAQNETGVLFPIEEIGRIIRENSDAVFHVDGVQAVGKIPIRLSDWPVDLFSISGHKFHAPKGVGALYVREGVKLPPFIIGGGQDRRQTLRNGSGAEHRRALGRASQLAKDFTGHEQIRTLRDRLEQQILATIPNTKVNGSTDPAERLPNTSNISFEGVLAPEIVAKLDEAGICVSTGSACHSDSSAASPVLTAMKIPRSLAMGSIRFSLGRYNTEAEIDRTRRSTFRNR